VFTISAAKTSGTKCVKIDQVQLMIPEKPDQMMSGIINGFYNM
jgi:hypothetical protein